MLHPRVLIVGTVPYNKNSSSRAYGTYFCNWEKENLAQVFSSPLTPVKGQCKTLYQITDKTLLKARLKKGTVIGKIYNYDDLPENSVDSVSAKKTLTSHLYKLGRKKNSLVYLLRKWLWKKKYWCTERFERWVRDFNPECVCLSFSDDFFIPDIAYYIAVKYNIPIVSIISDDYYFNDKFSLSPFYHLYRKKYKKLIETVLSYPGSAIYISDKIRDLYNNAFPLYGETVYIVSEISRRPFRPINKMAPVISYFGNIRAGRNESLDEIGKALGRIDPGFILNVYSSEQDRKYFKLFDHNPNIVFHGEIPYSEVLKKSEDSDILIIVEGFNEKDINLTRCSLSTKAADSLASGVAVLAYGSGECGVIQYMKQTAAAAVCTDANELQKCISRLIYDIEYQKANYKTAEKITAQNHSLKRSPKIFENVVSNLLKGSQGLCLTKNSQ